MGSPPTNSGLRDRAPPRTSHPGSDTCLPLPGFRSRPRAPSVNLRSALDIIRPRGASDERPCRPGELAHLGRPCLGNSLAVVVPDLNRGPGRPCALVPAALPDRPRRKARPSGCRRRLLLRTAGVADLGPCGSRGLELSACVPRHDQRGAWQEFEPRSADFRAQP